MEEKDDDTTTTTSLNHLPTTSNQSSYTNQPVPLLPDKPVPQTTTTKMQITRGSSTPTAERDCEDDSMDAKPGDEDEQDAVNEDSDKGELFSGEGTSAEIQRIIRVCFIPGGI